MLEIDSYILCYFLNILCHFRGLVNNSKIANFNN